MFGEQGGSADVRAQDAETRALAAGIMPGCYWLACNGDDAMWTRMVNAAMSSDGMFTYMPASDDGDYVGNAFISAELSMGDGTYL